MAFYMKFYLHLITRKISKERKNCAEFGRGFKRSCSGTSRKRSILVPLSTTLTKGYTDNCRFMGREDLTGYPNITDDGKVVVKCRAIQNGLGWPDENKSTSVDLFKTKNGEE
ncbi:10904_t:CDS:2 [Funneliformis geosporum]|uniref:476_t:CDS:1 n=1 Tax=Funneliformis geosporum TaxID=1117311 RepID=A0A9W4WQI5_9GLOM|nr:10904_t:CDS:2 [Funneliformis geosporum]CAI2164464.1 476_t:CDS:2 [Funneliformis geosporum]